MVGIKGGEMQVLRLGFASLRMTTVLAQVTRVLAQDDGIWGGLVDDPGAGGEVVEVILLDVVAAVLVEGDAGE